MPWTITFRPGAAPVSFGDGPDDVETETGTLHAQVPLTRSTIKPFENAFQLGFRDTDSMISDAHGDMCAIDCRRFYRNADILT